MIKNSLFIKYIWVIALLFFSLVAGACQNSYAVEYEIINPPLDLTVDLADNGDYLLRFYAENKEANFKGFMVTGAGSAKGSRGEKKAGVFCACSGDCKLDMRENPTGRRKIRAGSEGQAGEICGIDTTDSAITSGNYVTLRAVVKDLAEPVDTATDVCDKNDATMIKTFRCSIPSNAVKLP